MKTSNIKLAVFVCLLSTLSLPAHATNGINLIGFGGESTLMAGADVAVARDTSALNTNPAGLAQIKGERFNGFGSILRTLDLSHQDQFDNDQHASNRYTLLGGGGYAMSLDSLPCTIGIGLFAQGGAGGVFKNINTAFGTQDRFSALFSIAKITPGIGCQITDRLSLGISYGLVYASLDQKLFPKTSYFGPPQPFFGYELKGADSLQTSFKIGMQYRATPKLMLGAAFTEKTRLPLSGGRLSFNESSVGLGTVTYRNANIDGFALPREIAIGAAFQATDDLLLSLKLNWINWGGAMNNSTLTATDPDNSASALGARFIADSALDWKNQWVIATGLAYKMNDKTILYAGNNYGKNPVPTSTTTPNLAAILEHHFTLGAAYKFDPEWTFTGGIEYDPQVKVDYTNVQLPFGTNSELRNEAVFLHFMVSREW